MEDIKKIYEKIELEWGVVLAVAKACEKRSVELVEQFKELNRMAKEKNEKYEITPESIIGDMK